MASSYARQMLIAPSATTTTPRYFFISITNYPNVLQNIRAYQQPSYQQREQNNQDGMLIPGVTVHFGIAHSNEHERLLYNTLRFELQEAIRGYLHRTRQFYPICLVFDMTGIEQQR